jgi:hypothetical protein
MRLTALLLTVLTVSVARNAPTREMCGMWVTDLTKSDLGAGARPTQLILNVTREGNRLKVIEVASDEGWGIRRGAAIRVQRSDAPCREGCGNRRDYWPSDGTALFRPT